jgi:hypothetical protein
VSKEEKDSISATKITDFYKRVRENPNEIMSIGDPDKHTSVTSPLMEGVSMMITKKK